MLDYVVITPAYNEEDYIEFTLSSMVKQTHVPKRWIIVNDGSTDGTAALVMKYANQYDWIQLVNKLGNEKRSIGSKVIQTFNYGFQSMEAIDYDVIVKLDADLTLPPDYFERVCLTMEENPNIGLCGGVCSILKGKEWEIEKVADNDHVRGAMKAYRKKLFDQMGGLKTSMGWDTVDELLAKYYDWDIKVLSDLVVKHHRTTNTETGQLKACFKMGRSFYLMRYGFLISSIAALKIGAVRDPKVITAYHAFKGYWSAKSNKEEHIVNEKEGEFIRKYRWQRIRGKIK